MIRFALMLIVFAVGVVLLADVSFGQCHGDNCSTARGSFRRRVVLFERVEHVHAESVAACSSEGVGFAAGPVRGAVVRVGGRVARAGGRAVQAVGTVGRVVLAPVRWVRGRAGGCG
jgi:hypothetical protein